MGCALSSSWGLSQRKNNGSLQVQPDKKTSSQRRQSFCSISDFLRDAHLLLKNSDLATIRNQFGNYFTMASTHRRIEFAYGKTEDASGIKGVNIDGFQFSNLLGCGGFGAVFRARRRSTGIEYALKLQPMEYLARSAKSSIKKKVDETLIYMERSVLACCRGHPFIVNLEYAFHTDVFAVLALEYIAGGTLSRLISRSPEGRLPFDLCKTYIIELILALNFMHRKGIIYRDVKPSNILITLKGHIKLTDFGLAGSLVKKKRDISRDFTSTISEKPLHPDLIAMMTAAKHDEPTGSTQGDLSDSSSHDPEISYREQTSSFNEAETNEFRWIRRRTVCGTAGYRPPEQVQERYVDYSSRSGYDERADWFSLGVCCFTMLTGHRPFPTKKELIQSDLENIECVKSGTIPNNNRLDDNAASKVLHDAEFRCLMFRVKYPDYFERHRDAKQFIDSLLTRNPEDRPRYEAIRNLAWIRQESFEEEDVLRRPIAKWVIEQACIQSLVNKTDRPRRAKGKTLNECIGDLMNAYYEKNGSTHMDSFSLKWSARCEPKTTALFRHWSYISADAIEKEVSAIRSSTNSRPTRKFLKK